MRAPLSWLRDYAPLAAPAPELAERMSGLGLVVEGVEEIGGGLGDIVVARVLDVRNHPNAERIRLVDVDTGDGETQIVCGAWNFQAGDLVPLAPVGARLPGGFEISRRKMRGEWSNGMLCSADELQLPSPAGPDGLLILPAGLAAPGVPLVEALDLQPDVVFDLDISANRPDALCMAGVARDLAAALGEPWSMPPNSTAGGPAAPPVDEALGTASISVAAGDLCPRFTATILEGVPDGPSPVKMARRLTLAGMRPISAVVDVSNYVMLDLGQPNHAYDLDQLAGDGLLIRRGRPDERLVTLDGVERVLGADDCVISDAGGTAVGVGGIMGGSRAEIGPGTRRVLLEAAWFLPMSVARTGARLGLHSEARVRFERGVDPEIAGAAVERFVALLATVPAADGVEPGDGPESREGPVRGSTLRRGPTVDRRSPSLPAPVSVPLRTARVNAIIGADLDDAAVAGLLEPIGFSVRPDGPGAATVGIPSWRLDCEREIDVIEEVARTWGYGRIERTIPPGVPGGSGGLTERQRQVRRLRDILAGAGYDEAWTTTFLAPGDLERAGLDPAAVEVENPLDRSESFLRTELLPGLLKAVKFNVDRQAEDVALFEIGHVFALPQPPGITPDETERLAVMVAPAGGVDGGSAGDSDGGGLFPAAAGAAVQTWRYLADALRLDAPVLVAARVAGLHPTRAALITGGDGRSLGAVGEVDPDVVEAYGLRQRLGYLTLSVDALLAEPGQPWQAREVSRFPASDIDLAFVVPDAVPAGAVHATLAGTGGGLLERVSLFDVYRSDQLGAAGRSLAFRLRYRAQDRTLDEAVLAELRQQAIDAVVASHRASLRS
jgi:phenylalanyl-tRNA synthetase beta chain